MWYTESKIEFGNNNRFVAYGHKEYSYQTRTGFPIDIPACIFVTDKEQKDEYNLDLVVFQEWAHNIDSFEQVVGIVKNNYPAAFATEEITIVATKTKKSNPASKTRTIDKPYASWTDAQGFKHKLLKSHQDDNGKPYARWLMSVEGRNGEDRGDSYVNVQLSGLKNSSNLVFDTTLWADRDAFVNWAFGK